MTDASLDPMPLAKSYANVDGKRMAYHEGAILTGPQREFCRTWPNQTEVTVPGSHFIQEDSPHEIGQAIANWLPSL